MFVVQALFDFNSALLHQLLSQQPSSKQEKLQKASEEQELDKGKRRREGDHDAQLRKEGGDKDYQEGAQKQDEQVQYLSFSKGDKILVEQAFDSGWWLGHLIKEPQDKGFFPSNYVKVGAKPPPPPPKPSPEQEQDNADAVYDPQEGADWMNKKMAEGEDGQKPIQTSEIYQGITKYKYVKVNDNNKNILKGNYVKFDVSTGLAKVPVKSQAPAAKAVRQMGYYFDYNEWNEDKNKNPEIWKNKPDASRKRKKRLNLVGMGKEG